MGYYDWKDGRMTTYEPHMYEAPLCAYCRQLPEAHADGRCPKSQSNTGLIWDAVVCGIFALAGFLCWLFTSPAVTECRELGVFAAASSTCGDNVLVHQIGSVAGVLGLMGCGAFIVAAAVRGTK